MDNRNGDYKSGKASKRGLLIVVTVIAIAVLIAAGVWYVVASSKITNFSQCRDAGGKVIDDTPSQCKIYGKSFSDTKNENNNSSLPDESQYKGLSIDVAIEKAKSDGVPYRIVKRDGESLPMTTDLIKGRLNFTVADDIVTDVEVEGEQLKNLQTLN